MFTQMFALRAQDDDEGVGAGLLGLGAVEPRQPRAKPTGFKECGLSFIDLRQAHLDLLAYVYDKSETPMLEECVGQALVDKRYLPLGLCLVHREKSGCDRLYAYFGSEDRWLRTYPKDVLRALSRMATWLREREVFVLHAYVEQELKGLCHLLKWLGGKPVEDHADWFKLDLRECKI